ncbi:hypothetical protein C8R46DRAFT_1213595 [Mycena filopes]|nr:hypothetical protein C8R46DRAFT_1213595 [Mycena filopes]
MHAYRESLPGAPSEHKICVDLLAFVRLYAVDAFSRGAVAPPALQGLATRAWVLVSQLDPGLDDPALSHLSSFLNTHMRAADPESRAQIFEAAGGPDGLGELLTRYFKLILPPAHPRPHRITHILSLLNAALLVLEGLDDAGGPLTQAFVRAGLVQALTTTACALGDVNMPETIGHLLIVFQNLQKLFLTPPSYTPIGQALSAGLLRAIARCAVLTAGADKEKVKILEHLLEVLLPISLVYYSVVVKLPAALLQVDPLVMAPAFTRLPIYKHWRAFYALAKHRIEMLRSPRKLLSFKACDNMECGAMSQRLNFGRCSCCQNAYYCSPDCQKRDWRSGRHRRECKSIRMFNLQHPEYMSPRNISFMRAVLHADGQIPGLNMERLHAFQALAHLASQADPLVTLFSFMTSKPTVHVHLASMVRARDLLMDIDWDTYIARAARSGGRMELQLMAVADGRRERFHMFPLRSKEASILDDTKRGIWTRPGNLQPGAVIPDALNIS